MVDLWDEIVDAKDAPEVLRRRKARGMWLLAFASGLLAISVALAVMQYRPPPDPPRLVDTVTLVEVRANVTGALDNASGQGYRIDEVFFLCEMTWHGSDGIDYYASTSWDASVTTVVIVNYGNDPYFSFGGANAFVAFLREGESANVSAAMLRGMVLYSVRAGAEPALVAGSVGAFGGQVAVGNGTVTASYLVNGSTSIGGQRVSGDIRVNETHAVEVHRAVPVIQHPQFVCL